MLRSDGCEEQSIKNYQNSLFRLWILVTLSYSVKPSIVAGKKMMLLLFHFESLFLF